MLQQFVVEILFGEVCVKCNEGIVSSGGVRKRGFGTFLPVFLDLLLCNQVVGSGLTLSSEHILHIRAVEVGFGEIRIQFNGFVVIFQSVVQTVHFHEYGRSVVVGEDVVGVDVDDPVHVFYGLVILSDLGVDEASVVKCERVAWILLQHYVEV